MISGNSFMNERRKFDRKFLAYFSRVIDRQTGTLIGYLVDMTPGGVMIISNYPLQVKSQYELLIDLPEDGETKDEVHLEVQAKAIWCMQDNDPELYRTGLELTHINPEHLALLKKVISNYGISKKV